MIINNKSQYLLTVFLLRALTPRDPILHSYKIPENLLYRIISVLTRERKTKKKHKLKKLSKNAAPILTDDNLYNYF